ncbi:MAG: hypothetical protein SVR08_15160 [Spirochaetota bacterium]|nr:hypothetical protein [Spirochaetota bacterium]
MADRKGLETKNEICTYMRCDWRRIEMLIKHFNFPAKKIGGQWVSDKELIDEWRRKILSQDTKT